LLFRHLRENSPIYGFFSFSCSGYEHPDCDQLANLSLSFRSARLEKTRKERLKVKATGIAAPIEEIKDWATASWEEIEQSKDVEEDGSNANMEPKHTSISSQYDEETDEMAVAAKISDETELDLEDYNLTKEDILGPSPMDAILESDAWKRLQRLVGLHAVKQSILSIFELSKTNYQRDLEDKPLIQLSFNRMFLGPPGTGKTVVAKLYGQILAEIGVLSKGELVVRNPSDLIGQYIGDSEANTKAALSAAQGNVLLIDEAYMMYTEGEGTGNESDSYRQAIIDTLVAEVQSVPGEDRCVLLLGYTDEMHRMIQKGNPGLARRFPLADAFYFQNFTMEELERILRTKLEDSVVEATEEAIRVAMCVLDKARSRTNFGNGGEVENLITRAKTNYQIRVSALPIWERPEKWIFEPQDFDSEFDRGKTATLNLQKLFEGVVGCEAIIRKLEGYQCVSQSMKLKHMDPKDFIPTNFLFKGAAGTGKTTTARKIAQVYYDMGFLAEASVVECSASDIIGKWVGHTGPQVIDALERGLGKVLFIDEAHRRASNHDRNSFDAEAISELVDCLTKPKFHGKLVVILAGYENELNYLLSTNQGLASRFPEELIFDSMAPQDCLQVLKIKLKAANITIPVIDDSRSVEYQNLLQLVDMLSETPFWGNARDIETLAKSLCRTVFMSIQRAEDDLVCSAEMAIAAAEDLLKVRNARRIPHHTL
jgi:SpoVK/Ycf46/Vps4 family AAA+-type ATPase